MRKMKKMDFSKIAWHYLCQEGGKKHIFVHTVRFGQDFCGPKQWNQEKL